jgi:hypothetical protein
VRARWPKRPVVPSPWRFAPVPLPQGEREAVNAPCAGETSRPRAGPVRASSRARRAHRC